MPEPELAPTRVIARWLARTILGTPILGVLMFVIAGRLDWIMAWVYLAGYTEYVEQVQYRLLPLVW